MPIKKTRCDRTMNRLSRCALFAGRRPSGWRFFWSRDLVTPKCPASDYQALSASSWRACDRGFAAPYTSSFLRSAPCNYGYSIPKRTAGVNPRLDERTAVRHQQSVLALLQKNNLMFRKTVVNISDGRASRYVAFLEVISRDLHCSHSITPVVFVLESSGTCRGNPLSVFVIGHTIAICVYL